MAKIKLYQLCLFDMENKLNLKDSGTATVKVQSIKRRLLRKDIYTVVSLQNGNVIECNKEHLLPVWDRDSDDVKIMLRHPDDAPAITQSDMKTLNDIIELTKNSPDINQRLELLRTKLFYYMNMNNI